MTTRGREDNAIYHVFILSWYKQIIPINSIKAKKKNAC